MKICVFIGLRLYNFDMFVYSIASSDCDHFWRTTPSWCQAHVCQIRLSTPRRSPVLARDLASFRSLILHSGQKVFHDFERPYLRIYSSHCAHIWRACSRACPLGVQQVSCQSDRAFSIEQMNGPCSSSNLQLTVQCDFRLSYLSFLWTDSAEIWTGCHLRRPVDV